ncbi:AmmeMemoRadiSam system protein B [Candidatus Parcubacteria bacterium]|nr:AmmeMemoRadiSam system protein B [Candidatus Parcubacteria bacterium]
MKKLILIILLLILTACTKQQVDKPMEPKFQNIRQPAVAGQFYPADADNLKFKIEKYLSAAEEQKVEGIIKAIMVPHAGYVFSAPVAAYSYKQLQGKKIRTAVIICNSHTAYFEGIAIDESDAWQTPLGLVEVDRELAKKLVKSDNIIKHNSNVHEDDHTLEVQLPFLQTVLADQFKIVPILFGNAHDDSYKKLAKALADNLGEDDIVVISTDMSHYPAYEDANKIDSQTLEMIKSADILKLESHIKEVESQNIPNEQTVLCGIDGVKTVIELYNLLSWNRIEILKYANSGDARLDSARQVAIGDPTSSRLRGASKDSVVGYGAVVFALTPGPSPASRERGAIDNVLNEEQKKELLHIARVAVESYVREGKVPEFNVSDERLEWKQGVFVTLHNSGKLRGCIGQIVPSDKPLWQVVRDMAVAACSKDHRFSPASKKELDDINYEVSVLSVPKKINNWQDIELGKHGVILQKGSRSGVFLPQVADETGWSKEEFLSQLCSQKAGLAPDCYKNDSDVELKIFTAQVFRK